MRAHTIAGQGSEPSPPASASSPLAPPGLDREERANAATHAIGLAAGLAGSALLMRQAISTGGVWQIVGCGLYAMTLVATYAASTASHLFHGPRSQRALRTADQACIFLFIAGSYTPMALTWLRGGAWWLLHGFIWGVALAGFASKVFFSHRVGVGSVSTVLYIALGWSPVAAAWPIIGAAPAGLLWWLLAGGICYSTGILFFHFDHRVRYFHAAWHLCVMAGSACTFLGILRYCAVLPSGA